MKIPKQLKNMKYHAISFGQPRFGNKRAVEYVQSSVQFYRSFANCGDRTTLLPPLAFNYVSPVDAHVTFDTLNDGFVFRDLNKAMLIWVCNPVTKWAAQVEGGPKVENSISEDIHHDLAFSYIGAILRGWPECYKKKTIECFDQLT